MKNILNLNHFAILAGLPLFFFINYDKVLLIFKMTLCLRFMKAGTFFYNLFEEKIKNEVSRQIALISLTVVLLVIFCASLVELFENDSRRKAIASTLQICHDNKITSLRVCLYESKKFLFFHKLLYFVIVTLSTVGYGDIVPISFVGNSNKAISSAFVYFYLQLFSFQNKQTN